MSLPVVRDMIVGNRTRVLMRRLNDFTGRTDIDKASLFDIVDKLPGVAYLSGGESKRRIDFVYEVRGLLQNTRREEREGDQRSA